MLCETGQTAYLPLIAKCLTAIVPIAISCAVAYIAYQQHKLAKERFKLDLFEKRYAVYKATETALKNIITSGRIDDAELLNLLKNYENAQFLFNKTLIDFLGKIYDSACVLNGSKEKKPLDDFTKYSNDLNNKFAPDLKFKNWK